MKSRTNSIVTIITALVVGLAAGSCAPTFPKQELEKVDRSILFPDLQKDPERYKGKWILLGGMIVETRNTPEGTVIEMLQKPLDSRERPLSDDTTDGRFLAVSDRFLDPAVYHKGRELTLIAEVIGRKVMPLGELEYQYPLVLSKDLRLWEPSSGPRFFFGIGVSRRI